jgi:hypothetical protein
MAAGSAMCIPVICRPLTAFWTFAAVMALTAFRATRAYIALFAVVRLLIGCVFRIVVTR